MVQPLSTQDELKERLSFLGPNQDQWNLEDRLLDATLELETMVGREVEEQLRPENKDQRKFSFAFSNIEQVHKVILQSNVYEFEKEVDSSDYTITQEPTRSNPVNIEFTQSFAEDELFNNDYRLRVIYVPELFKRLELKVAKWGIAVDYATQTSSEDIEAKVEKIEGRKNALKQNINRTTQNLGDKDAGDSLTANYNFPGNR